MQKNGVLVIHDVFARYNRPRPGMKLQVGYNYEDGCLVLGLPGVTDFADYPCSNKKEVVIEGKRTRSIRIPQDLLRKASISGPVVMVGVKDKIEIWDTATWNRINSSSLKRIEKIGPVGWLEEKSALADMLAAVKKDINRIRQAVNGMRNNLDNREALREYFYVIENCEDSIAKKAGQAVENLNGGELKEQLKIMVYGLTHGSQAFLLDVTNAAYLLESWKDLTLLDEAEEKLALVEAQLNLSAGGALEVIFGRGKRLNWIDIGSLHGYFIRDLLRTHRDMIGDIKGIDIAYRRDKIPRNVVRNMQLDGLFSVDERNYYLGKPTPLMSVEEAMQDPSLKGHFDVATINAPNKDPETFAKMIDEAEYFGSRVIFLHIKAQDVAEENLAYTRSKGYYLIEIPVPEDYPWTDQLMNTEATKLYMCVKAKTALTARQNASPVKLRQEPVSKALYGSV